MHPIRLTLTLLLALAALFQLAGCAQPPRDIRQLTAGNPAPLPGPRASEPGRGVFGGGVAAPPASAPEAAASSPQ